MRMAKERELLPSPAMIAVQAGAITPRRHQVYVLAWYATWQTPLLTQQRAALIPMAVLASTAALKGPAVTCRLLGLVTAAFVALAFMVMEHPAQTSTNV
jgi:hypothetical protein